MQCISFIGGAKRGGRGQPGPFTGAAIRSQMYFYYTNRGAHIYLASGGNTPAPPLVSFINAEKYLGDNLQSLLSVCVCGGGGGYNACLESGQLTLLEANDTY